MLHVKLDPRLQPFGAMLLVAVVGGLAGHHAGKRENLPPDFPCSQSLSLPNVGAWSILSAWD